MTRTILCYGDSNTHGTPPMRDIDDTRRHPRHIRWPGAMAAKLGDAFEVIEEGHGGRTTVHPDPYDGAHRSGAMILPAILESHRPLDAVILMLGTNDLKGMFNVSPFEIGLSIGKLTQTIQTSACGPDGSAPHVLIVAPPPIIETGFLADMYRGGADKSRELARQFETTAKRCGTEFFDAGTLVNVDPQEGIHFDAENHIALGNALAGKVRKIWKA